MRFVKQFTRPDFRTWDFTRKLRVFFTMEQRKWINMSNLSNLLLEFNWVSVQNFNSLNVKSHLVLLWKFCKKNVHIWLKFYTAAGCDGRDKSQLCNTGAHKEYTHFCLSPELMWHSYIFSLCSCFDKAKYAWYKM